MNRVAEHLLSVSDLHNFAEIHDRDPLTDIMDGAETMCNKEICDAKIFLKLLQQVENLRLNRHIQC